MYQFHMNIDLERTEQLIETYLNKMPKKYDALIKAPTLFGVEKYTENEAILRVTAETKPMLHYEMARVISVGLKKYLKEEGIDIPYPTLITQSFHKV